MPAIARHALRQVSANWHPEAKAQAIQHRIANAMAADACALFHLGVALLAYASPSARYAISQTREGRIVGNRTGPRVPYVLGSERHPPSSGSVISTRRKTAPRGRGARYEVVP